MTTGTRERPRMGKDGIFPAVPDIVPEGRSGDVRIVHFEMTETDEAYTRLRATITGMCDEYCPAGTYAKLYIGDELVMSDTLMERDSNRDVVRHANGDVLIAGLGLGMILHPILAKPNVRSVTVIENNMDVIRLVRPHVMQSKLNIWYADIWKWRPAKGVVYDTIYFDIWPNRSADNLEEMARLHRSFARRLSKRNPNRWMNSWYRDMLIARRRRGY